MTEPRPHNPNDPDAVLKKATDKAESLAEFISKIEGSCGEHAIRAFQDMVRNREGLPPLHSGGILGNSADDMPLFGEAIPLAKPRAHKTWPFPTTEEGRAAIGQNYHLKCVKVVVQNARDDGYIITVEQHPLQPLAMGNTETVFSIRKARKLAPQPHALIDFDKMAADALARIKRQVDVDAEDVKACVSILFMRSVNESGVRHIEHLREHRKALEPFRNLLTKYWISESIKMVFSKASMNDFYAKVGL